MNTFSRVTVPCVIGGTVFLSVLLQVGVASAQQATDPACAVRLSSAMASSNVDEQHEMGLSMRRDGCNSEALTLFRSLWERGHEARSLVRMAGAELAIRDYPSAERHLEQALRELSADAWLRDPNNRAQTLTALARSRELQGVAVLTVRCNVAAAQVYINNQPLSSCGVRTRMSQATISIEVRADGYRAERRTITLAAGADVTEAVSLIAEPPVSPVTPLVANDRLTTSNASSSAATASPRAVIVTETHPHPLRPVAWVALGGAVVGAGIGIVGHVVGQPAADKWNSETTCQVASPSAECIEARDSAQTMGIVRAAGFIGGGVLAATSIVFFIVTPPQVEATTRTAFRCSPALTTAGVVCGGRF